MLSIFINKSILKYITKLIIMNTFNVSFIEKKITNDFV